jgi:hypothetical protein
MLTNSEENITPKRSAGSALLKQESAELQNTVEGTSLPTSDKAFSGVNTEWA